MKRLTKNQIYQICERLFDRLPELLSSFEVEYVEYPNRYAFACPIHGGDNSEGCCIFTDGMTQKGNWSCWTQHCEEEFANNLFGFVRGVLSEKENRKISLNETADYCSDFLDMDIDNIQEVKASKNENSKIIDIFNKAIAREPAIITREEIRSKISIPSKYYIGRGLAAETLDLFDVGECFAKKQPMSGRVVVPVYDEDYNYVGCVGRSTNESMKPKWLHSKGFKKSVLYGLNVASEHIKVSQTAILVEGQGDVWKMHEAGYNNCVGIFGSSINDDQLLLLEKSGTMNLVVLTDSDEAGEKAYNQILKKCGRRFNYFRPHISKKDVGDMTVEEIKQELDPQLKGIIK